MKKAWIALIAALLLAALAVTGICETLYVDNRETDKIYPERLNMRDAPSKAGGILGLYYTGAQVTVLGVENEEYTKVEIGGMTGYMASEYLITQEEAVARYGEDGGFGDCRIAEVDLTGLWRSTVPLLETTDKGSTALGTLRTGDRVALVGIIDDWAYIRAAFDGEERLGYVPLDSLTDVDERKVYIIAGKKADSQTNLYAAANDRAEVLMALKNGTACFSLFGRKEGEWVKVRVGGVTGYIRYTQTANLYALGSEPRSVVPYYPLQMTTKGDTLLYSDRDDTTQPYMTLGQDLKVEVLAESGESAYVRTMEGGAGAFDCGDFGYVPLNSLTLTAAGTSLGVAQVDDGDLPGILLSEPQADAGIVGALCAGAQVRITSFTQTDYAQVALGDVTGYLLKDAIRVLSEPDEPVSDRIPQRATVLSDLTLRTAPQANAQEGEEVAAGSRVYMLGQFGDWAYVRAADKPGLDVTGEAADHTGFALLSQLDAPASTTHLTAFVSTDKVNLRSEASSQTGQIIGKVRLGERLRVADYGTKWTCIVTLDGKRGYVMTQYLTFE